MIKKLLVLFSLFFFAFSITQLNAQKVDREAIKKKLMKEHLLNSSAQGREFWIAIPPNEVPEHSTNVLELYVTASENTVVEYWIPGRGKRLTKPINAMSVASFSTETGEMTWDQEVRISEKITHEGIRLKSDKPISVYVLNGKTVTSEGYLAIPMSSWGRKYIHCSYYDFKEGRPWATGFLLVAGEDNTSIKINLKGIGKGYAKTLHGRDIGDRWEVTLNKGDTYMVRGDAKTRGQFDMSGTEFLGNKPFGLISFHMRTMIPALVVTSGRDHLCEMMPPVTAWGKRYATVEYDRGSDKGDFFRIVASEPNTRYRVKWFDLISNRLIGQREGTLRNAGDFEEFLETPATMPHDLQSIRGASVWEADKPVLVMQYSYSANWDNASMFDPFMILVTAVEQYIPGTVFQTPANKAFADNNFNIIAIGDTADEENHFRLLKSIEIDGVPIWKNNQQFLFNRIPETDLYWAKLKVEPGAHHIQGDTKFGGYVYGFSSFDSYGWPAAMAFNTIGEVDSLPPQIFKTGTCGVFDIKLTELRNGEEGDDPIQIDKGVDEIVELEDSYNMEYSIDDFEAWPPNYDYTFEYSVVDPYQDGKAVFAVFDRAGNMALDSIEYEADSLLLDPEIVEFGMVRVNETKELPAKLQSNSDDNITLVDIRLKYGEVYTITQGDVNPDAPMPLAPGAIHDLMIAYTPDQEGLRERDKDVDTLIVETECLRWAWPVTGRGVIPRIEVEDWNAGTLVVGTSVCKKADQNRGLRIENPGTDTLIITGITGYSDPFSLSDPTVPPLPITVLPGEIVYLEEMCFAPTAVGNFSQDIVLHSNAVGPDSVSVWSGNGVQPGPTITLYDWGKRRVQTVNEGQIYMRNKGSSKVTITDIDLENSGDANFRIKSIKPQLNPVIELFEETNTNPNVTKEVVITVEFIPQAEETYHNAIVPTFSEEDAIEPGTVIGDLDGIGILPKLEVTGYTFWPPILLNDTHDDIGKVRIYNPSETSPTYIESINWSNNSDNDFEWVTQPTQDFELGMGESLEFDVRFTARGINDRLAVVEVVSDAEPGPQTDPRVTDTAHVRGYGYEKGLSVGNLDYGDVLLCDKPEMTVEIRNTSQTSVATIYDFIAEIGDIGSFAIEDIFPTDIQPGDALPVRVTFDPGVGSRTGPFHVDAKVYSNFDTLTSTFDAEVYDVTVSLDMPTLYGMAPGMQTIDNPPAQAFPIIVRSDDWADANVTDFRIDVIYKKDWMFFAEKITKGDVLDQSWTITATEYAIDDIWSRAEIEGHGTTPISRNGQLVRPVYTIMLADSSQFMPDFGEITFFDRDACVLKDPQPGEININTCVQDLRNVTFTTTKYALQEVGPNPATGSTVNIKYGVGLKTHTTLELYNSTGERVETLVDKVQEVGDYELVLSTDRLGSGTYIVRMKSGPYEDVRRFVIVK